MKLVIFDMDGLMFDTGRLAYRNYSDTAKKYDFELHPSVYYHLTGRNEPGFREALKELYGSEQPTDTWRDFMVSNKMEIITTDRRVYKKKGLLELLKFLKENDYLIAVASSSKREIISFYMEIEEMPDCFDTIVAGDEVTKGKPNPEIFLKACEKLNIAPEDALVLEDSLVGIEAANKANIPSFLIEDDITDLPPVEGKFPLKIKLPVNEERAFHPTEQFNDLLEVRDFIKNNK
ncbi:HAD family hydrolase [Vagococcus hydrophili]|nr:HAD family phosphatase [Vagococcus hydrophili]